MFLNLNLTILKDVKGMLIDLVKQLITPLNLLISLRKIKRQAKSKWLLKTFKLKDC